ncbi:MAG: thiamine phosphate synthase [Myxococcales bacterium]|nr:thiamine phosphate synthase [Myxococcales bacterium]
MAKINPTEGRKREPILCLVVDRGAVRGDLTRCVAAAVGAGVDWVQIRERDLEGAALLAHAEQIGRAARQAAAQRGGRVEIFVNRRIDIALALAADGVQLGFDAVDPKTARRLLGTDVRIGISAHHPDEIRTAPPEVDCAQLAPIAQPLSKQHAGPTLGVRAVAEAARCDIPVIAQGGITAANATAIAAAGAAGIAVTGAILSAPDPAVATRALRAALAAASRSRPGTSPSAPL